MENRKSDAGKGDSPRNCFSKSFKSNHENVNWSSSGVNCTKCGQLKNVIDLKEVFGRMVCKKKCS